MVVFNDDMLVVVALDLLAVDLGAGILALPERADIKSLSRMPCTVAMAQAFLASRFVFLPAASLRIRSDMRGVGTP